MTETRWLRNVRLWGRAATDVALSAGRIVECVPAGRVPPVAGDIDGGGHLLLPPLVDSHCHLDKTLWGLSWRPNSAGPTLRDDIANERRVLREIEAPIADRAGALLEQCIAIGSLTFRCHVDMDPDLGLRHVEALLALRERYADLIDLQFVAFPQSGLVSRPGTAALLREALRLGVDNVGGLDPCGIDDDPIAQLDISSSLQ